MFEAGECTSWIFQRKVKEVKNASMSSLIFTLLQMLWLFLPAVVANSIPVVAAHRHWLPALATPLDGGIKWRNRDLFGDHKTIRGFVVGIAAAGLVGWLQWLLWPLGWVEAVSLLPYTSP